MPSHHFGSARHAAVQLGVWLPFFLFTGRALADDPTKQQCIDADTNAQSLRSSGQLSAAREALRVCTAASCPRIVRSDCTERLDEIDRVQPTLVFAAQDEAGNDLSAVKITVDGKPFADSVDGPALPIDPGAHDLTFEAAGKTTVARHVVIHEGDKGRREQILFKAEVIAAASSTQKSPTTTHRNEPPPGEKEHATTSAMPMNTQRILGIAVAGAGVVGVGIGTIFGLSASSSWSSSQNECASPANCQNHAQAVSNHDSAVTSGTISTIAFIAGGALVAGGAVLFFTAPKSRASATVGIAPAFGGAVVRGTF